MKEFEKIEMTTMVTVTNNLTREGYTENFVAQEEGIEAPSNKRIYKPEEVRIKSFYRFEGISDPADNGVVFAVETNDGVKGQLIDAYGAYANPHISKFLCDVEAIAKKEHTNEVKERAPEKVQKEIEELEPCCADEK